MKPRTSCKTRCNLYCLTVSVTVKQLNNFSLQTKHAGLIVSVTIKAGSYRKTLTHNIT